MSTRANGFSKSVRLTRASEYQQVFSSSRRFSDNCFLLLVRENSMEYARLGLAISKKNVQSAVKRNFLKRLIRESFRNTQHHLKGQDIVVLTHKQTANKNKTELAESLRRNWEKIKNAQNPDRDN